METYYLSDAPALGPAAVVLSQVTALEGALGPALREAAAAVLPRDRLLVGVLWPDEPVMWPAGGAVLTTLDERLAYLRQREDALGHALTALVVPIGDTGDETVEQVLALVEGCAEVRGLWLPTATVDVLSGYLGAPGEPPPGFPTREYPISIVPHPDGAHSTALYPRIYQALERGDMEAVTAALGTYYPLTGLVVTGDQRGRTLGYPTANLRLDGRKRLPPNGIYAVRVRLPGEERATHPGAASIGVRPTFGAGMEKKVEVFLLDTSLDLYGQVLGVQIVAYLRPEERYDTVEALCAQMERDVANTRARLALAPHL